jgi:hypothetical protein
VKTLPYDEYLNPLLSAATTYDNQFVRKTKSNRHVFTHNQYDGAASYDIDDSYDIDFLVSLLLPNGAEHHYKIQIIFGNRAVHMPRDKW